MISIKRTGTSSGGRKGKPNSNVKAAAHGKVTNPKHHGSSKGAK
jgi:hypothetical protein